MKKTFWLLCVFLSQSAGADDQLLRVKQPAKIQKIIDAIPARGADLGVLLPRLGLRISEINLSRPDIGDLGDGTGMYRPGDRFIDIHFSDPLPRELGCPIHLPAKLLVRNGKYHPEDREANWLLTGRCVAPE